MADMTDVAQALVATIAQAIYPNGTTQPSICNCPVLIYQGWPNPQQLETGMRSGTVHVSVFPHGSDRVTCVMMGETEWQEQSNDGTQGVSVREIRRQTRTFQLTVWANCYDRREPAAKAIDSALALITRFTLPDGSQAVMTYQKSVQDDDQQRQGVYRRDFFYDIDYATIQADAEYTIKEIDTSVRRVVDVANPNSAALGAKVTVALTATSVATTITP